MTFKPSLWGGFGISLIDLKNFIQNVTNNYGEIVDNLSDELIAQYDLDDDG